MNHEDNNEKHVKRNWKNGKEFELNGLLNDVAENVEKIGETISQALKPLEKDLGAMLENIGEQLEPLKELDFSKIEQREKKVYRSYETGKDVVEEN